MGRMLILIGVVLIAIGVLVTLGERLPIRLGRLPGDIVVKWKNGGFYFPIVTCLLLSLLLTVLMWLFQKR